MAGSTAPSIVCLSLIGRNQNNPLHMQIFPSYDPITDSLAPIRTPIQFTLLLASTLDLFARRARQAASASATSSPNPGAVAIDASSSNLLLHAVDDRLAAYGIETNTGVKLVAVVDMRGRRVVDEDASKDKRGAGLGSVAGGAATAGFREAELKSVFKAVQTAYVRLLQNPFYDPDEHSPLTGRGGRKITSKRFTSEIRRIGEAWVPGVTTL